MAMAMDPGLTRLLVEYGVRELGMTCADIARELGVSRQCVSQHVYRSVAIAGPKIAEEYRKRFNRYSQQAKDRKRHTRGLR